MFSMTRIVRDKQLNLAELQCAAINGVVAEDCERSLSVVGGKFNNEVV